MHLCAENRRNQWRSEAARLWKVLKDQPLFMLGVGLYWGEGSKTHDCFSLSNSDPNVIRIMRGWCNQYFPNVAMRGRITAHSDVEIGAAKKFWANVSGVAISTITIVIATPISSKAVRPKRKLPFGTFTLIARKGSREMFTKMVKWLELTTTVSDDFLCPHRLVVWRLPRKKD